MAVSSCDPHPQPQPRARLAETLSRALARPEAPAPAARTVWGRPAAPAPRTSAAPWPFRAAHAADLAADLTVRSLSPGGRRR